MNCLHVNLTRHWATQRLNERSTLLATRRCSPSAAGAVSLPLYRVMTFVLFPP